MTHTPQDPFKASLEKFWLKAKLALGRGRDEVMRVSRIGKLKFEHSNLQRQRKTQFRLLGESVYAMASRGESIDLKVVSAAVEQIDKLQVQLRELEEEIRRAQAGDNRGGPQPPAAGSAATPYPGTAGGSSLPADYPVIDDPDDY